MKRISAAVALLLLSDACRSVPRVGHGSTPASGSTGQADAGFTAPEPPRAAASSQSKRPRVLDGEAVRRAYEALIAGRVEDARSLFSTLGEAADVTADEISNAFESPIGARGALLANTTALCRLDIGYEGCGQFVRYLWDKSYGGCVVESRIAIAEDGRVLGVFWGGEAAVWGRYLVTHSKTGSSTFKDIDSFQDLFSNRGYVVSAVDAGHKLVMFSPAEKPPATRGRDVGEWFDIWLVDPSARSVVGPWLAQENTDSRIEARWLANGSRLLVSDRYSVALLGLDHVRTVAAFATEGDRTWLVDREERTLFVSGIGRSARAPGGFGHFDHVAVDLRSGNVQRVGTTEPRADVPGRDMVLAADGRTLAIGSHQRIAFFSTQPFRIIESIKLDGIAMGDSSEDGTPHFIPLADGRTALATWPPGALTSDGAGLDMRVWLVSLTARKLIVDGTLLTGLYEDQSSHRSGFAMEPYSAEGHRVLVVVDEHGSVATREMAAGEGEHPGETLPGELASMRRRTEPTSEGASKIDQAVAARWAAKFCSVGGLFVPKAACPGRANTK